MKEASIMGIQQTLLDVKNRLEECLHDLDQIGQSIAAAHLSACLDVISQTASADSFSTDTD